MTENALTAPRAIEEVIPVEMPAKARELIRDVENRIALFNALGESASKKQTQELLDYLDRQLLVIYGWMGQFEDQASTAQSLDSMRQTLLTVQSTIRELKRELNASSARLRNGLLTIAAALGFLVTYPGGPKALRQNISDRVSEVQQGVEEVKDDVLDEIVPERAYAEVVAHLDDLSITSATAENGASPLNDAESEWLDQNLENPTWHQYRDGGVVHAVSQQYLEISLDRASSTFTFRLPSMDVTYTCKLDGDDGFDVRTVRKTGTGFEEYAVADQMFEAKNLKYYVSMLNEAGQDTMVAPVEVFVSVYDQDGNPMSQVDENGKLISTGESERILAAYTVNRYDYVSLISHTLNDIYPQGLPESVMKAIYGLSDIANNFDTDHSKLDQYFGAIAGQPELSAFDRAYLAVLYDLLKLDLSWDGEVAPDGLAFDRQSGQWARVVPAGDTE